MNVNVIKSAALLVIGFGIGALVTNLPTASATSEHASSDLSDREFMVSIDEIKQNFVPYDRFKGSYKQSFTLSDGSVRTIELTPMLHDGDQVAELKDTGGRTYMGLNGTTTNGTLMVQLRDVQTARALSAQAKGQAVTK